MVYINNSSKSNVLVHIDTANTDNITFVGGNKSHIRVSFTDGGLVVPRNSSGKMLMSLYSATIPISWYNIRSDNNTFILKEGTQARTLTIESGNYTSKSLAAQLTTLLKSGSYNDVTYEIIYNSIKNKYFYKATPAIGQTLPVISLVFPNDETPYIQMGFNSGSENVIAEAGNYCVNQVSMYDKFSIYLRSQGLIQGQSCYLNSAASNILERIPVQSFNTVSNYIANPLQHKFIVPDNITGIEFLLTYEDESKLIDLNGLNYQITLMFSFVSNLNDILPQKRVLQPNIDPEIENPNLPEILETLPNSE